MGVADAVTKEANFIASQLSQLGAKISELAPKVKGAVDTADDIIDQVGAVEPAITAALGALTGQPELAAALDGLYKVIRAGADHARANVDIIASLAEHQATLHAAVTAPAK